MNSAIAAADLTFLIVIEANRLEPQALLLCESIRAFAGRYCDSAIVAVSPRPDLAVGERTRARLEELAVRYVVEPLNLTGSPYGTVNRLVAGAWAERGLQSEFVLVLDTDTMILAEPSFERAAVGVRPVDKKGSASSGEGDPQDAYWRAMCGFAGISPDRLPTLTTSIDSIPIRASYNGGFTIVRRGCGILAKAEAVFMEAARADLRSLAGRNLNVHASTGLVGAEASEWWGSSQAALAVAIWSSTADVHVYDDRYNIPLHLLQDHGRSWFSDPLSEPILVHYHHLCERPYRDQLRDALGKVNCAPDVLNWIWVRLAYFDEIE
ncbi:MAG TPA: hypothetical protein VIJ94_12595 [Caulobacteraceae bacterium]